MQGWIKIHRQLQEKGYINKPAYVSLWVNILLLANHKEKEVMWNDSLITIKRGQFITGRKELSKLTGIPETTIERILKVFKSGHQIEQQTYNKYRLITVLNWDKFQVVDNKRTTNGQQTDTNKNEKNVNNNSEPSSDKNTMSFNKYSDDHLEGEINYDGDGSVTDPLAEKEKADKELNAKFRQAVDWLIKHQGRDPKRTAVPKQLKAIKKLYTMGVSADEAKQVIKESEASPLWQGRLEKPDYWTVVSIIQKRG